MVFGIFGIPMSVSGFIWLLVQSLIIFIVVVIAGKVLAHETSIKHSLILAFVAYFISNAAVFGLALIGIMIPFGFYIIPILVWIGLGELLIGGSRKTRLIIAIIAYATYILINFSNPLRDLVFSIGI